MKKDLLPFFTVKVNEGSGCLFQPACTDYCYVLTAKHIIGNKSPIIIQRQTLDQNGNLVVEDLEIIEDPYLHTDEHKDAAIIKVKPVCGVERLIRDELSEDNTKSYFLCGHPEARVDNNYTFRENEIIIENKQQYGYIEAELSKSALQREIIGQSGGGIIKIEESCYLLAGIQKRMAVSDEQEALGRIVFSPISFFDEIIAASHEKLSPLFPPYIVSFEQLLKNIFRLDNLLLKKNLIYNQLKSIATDLCNVFTPEKIIGLYGDEFLAFNSNPSLINHRELWISFLELLTINQLHLDNKLTFEELSILHKKRRLLFVDTDSWAKKLEEIYKSDLTDLEKGGTLVVCATREKIPSKLEFTEEELPLYDISVSYEEMNISNTITDPFKDIKIKNLYKFQFHIINNVLAFQNANMTNIKEILKDETRDVF